MLIDDNKARIIAETLGINCIGSIGLLMRAKQMGLIKQIKPIFEKWIQNERYFSKKILNDVLSKVHEELIK